MLRSNKVDFIKLSRSCTKELKQVLKFLNCPIFIIRMVPWNWCKYCLWGWHLCGGLKGISIWMMHQHIGLRNEIKQRTKCSRLGLTLFAQVSTTKQLIKNFINLKAWMGKAEYNMLLREREIIGTFKDKQEEKHQDC